MVQMIPNRTTCISSAMSLSGVMVVLAHGDAKIEPFQEGNISLIAHSMAARVSSVRF